MKYLGKSSVSHFLKIVLNVFWFFGCLSLTIFILMLYFAIFVSERELMIILSTFIFSFIALILLFIIFHLRKILDTLIEEKPFVLSNVFRFRYIGFSVLVIGIILFIKDLYLKGSHTFTIVDASPGNVETNVQIFLPFILGIFSLILGEIFKIAYQIHEENKLTI